MNTFATALLSIVLSVAAQFCMKSGLAGVKAQDLIAHPLTARAALGILMNGFVLTGLFLYGIGALAWLAVLSKWDVSKAYPLVGLGFAVTVAIGTLTGEHVTAGRVTGVALICAGVWMVARS